MFNRYKFPRMKHLPNSKTITNDDKVLPDVSNLLNKPLIVLYKMDGSNIVITNQFVHNRAAYPKHSSFDMIKTYWTILKMHIPNDMQIYGEWLYAKHSIAYKDKLALDNYFQVFSIFYEDMWLSWNHVKSICTRLGLTPVKVHTNYLYFQDEKTLLKEIENIAVNAIENGHEGIVVRTKDQFKNFGVNMAKYVRRNHIQTDEHWLKQNIIPNELKQGITWNDLLSRII